MDFIYIKICNYFTLECIQKLLYIYINQWTIQKKGTQILLDKKLLEVENYWLEKNHIELTTRLGNK